MKAFIFLVCTELLDLFLEALICLLVFDVHYCYYCCCYCYST